MEFSGRGRKFCSENMKEVEINHRLFYIYGQLERIHIDDAIDSADCYIWTYSSTPNNIFNQEH